MKKYILFLSIGFIHLELDAQGCTKGNCYNGFGSYKYGNGNRYTGEFKSGKRHGKGIYYYGQNNKYLGEWVNDQREGEGKLYYSNGDVYTGAFRSNAIEGQGNMDFKSGDRYIGQWKSGKPNGKGAYYFAAGERYEGQFLNARFEGEGNLYYKTGSYYKGQWKASKKDGYGEFRDVSGKIVAAYWKNDKLVKLLDEGQAERNTVVTNEISSSSQTPDPELNKIPSERHDDKIQDGITQKENQQPAIPVPVKENKPSAGREESLVKVQLPNCNTVHCANGRGMFTYGDGSKYIGDFLDGEPHGKGVCYYINGDRYEGNWERHAPHGEGIMYFHSGLTYGAIWEYGKSVKELQRKREFVFDNNVPIDKSPEVKIWAVIIGIARYEHMPALKYSDDDAYKIYAFLKSPEGGALQDEQIRILIDEDATRINILQTLNQVFMRADENDVVMMYYSGHGLEGTFIPIDYDGMTNLLKHDDVKEIINRSKAKHKVCYLDACNSGSLLAAKGSYSNALLSFYEEMEKAGGGTAFLTSSKSKEFSLEDGGLRQGIFSHFLINGLKGQADQNKDKVVTLKELFHYVYKNVREYTSNVQTPMIAGEYDENMPVGFIR